MLKALTLTLLTVVFFSVYAHAETPPQVSADSAIENELNELRLNMLKAYEGNIADLLPYLHPDIVVTWQDGEVSKGPDGVKKYYQGKMEGPNRVVAKVTGNPVVEDRRIFGDQIVSFGNMNDTFVLLGKEDEPLQFNSRFSSLVVRHEGKLKLAGMHMSVNAFDNPITDYAAAAVKKLAIFAGLGALVVGLILGRLTAPKKA